MTNELGDVVAQLRSAMVNYGRTADPDLLDEAIGMSDRVTLDSRFVGLRPDVIAATWSLGGAARIHRSRLSDNPRDFDDAIAWCRRALDAAPDADANRPSYASNLATILSERYDQGKDQRDLDEAVALFDWAVPAIRRAGRPASVALHNQGQALTELFSLNHDVAVLNTAIGVLRDAVADTAQPGTEAGGYLTSLGQALRARAEAMSEPSDLDEAVEVLRRAEDWTAGSDDHLAAMVSLGNALLDRSEMRRGTQDLAESASYLERALAEVSTGTPQWGHLASNVGNALLAGFRAAGRRESLLRARELFRDAAGTFADYSRDWEVCMSNLAACLQELHEQTGELSFLDEAIEVFRATVARAAGPERLHNFGVTLLARFKRYQSADDLDQAITQFRAAARLAPPSSVIHAAATNSLGNALSLRFDLLGQDTDANAAVSAHAEAVRSARENSIDHAMYQANLGVSLMMRGQRANSADDLDAAIHEQESAAADIPHASQEYIRVVAGLADSLAARATLTGSGADATRAREAYRTATLAGLDRFPEQAIGSAGSWGTWAADRQSFAEAAQAFEYGLRAVDQLFAIQLTRQHKETWLRDAQGMSVQAAYALARSHDPRGASRAVERGRALLLSEALQWDRANVEQLAKAGRPDLKDRYEAAVSRWTQLSRTRDDAGVPEPDVAGSGQMLAGSGKPPPRPSERTRGQASQ